MRGCVWLPGMEAGGGHSDTYSTPEKEGGLLRRREDPRSAECLPDTGEKFSERECMRGGLGKFAAQDAMALMLAHALKMKKYGA